MTIYSCYVVLGMELGGICNVPALARDDVSLEFLDLIGSITIYAGLRYEAKYQLGRPTFLPQRVSTKKLNDS